MEKMKKMARATSRSPFAPFLVIAAAVMTIEALMVLLPKTAIGSSLTVGAYTTVQNAGSSVTQRSVLNFVSGCTPVDNAGTKATDVTCSGGGGATIGGVNAQTVGYTPVSGDSGKLVTMNGSNLTLTLPSPPPSNTWLIWVENLNATNVTISRNGLTINGGTANITLPQYEMVNVWTNGTNYFASLPFVAGTNMTITPASNGITFAASGGGGGGNVIPLPTITPVIDANFAWANQQTASYTNTNNTIYLTVPTLGGDNLCARETSVPGAAPYTSTFMFAPTVSNNSNMGVGVELRDSVSGTMVAMQFDGSLNSTRCISGSLTGWSGAGGNQYRYGSYTFGQINNTGTNVNFLASNDGVSFSVVCTVAIGIWPNTPNKVGFYVQSEGAPSNASMAVYSYTHTP